MKFDVEKIGNSYFLNVFSSLNIYQKVLNFIPLHQTFIANDTREKTNKYAISTDTLDLLYAGMGVFDPYRKQWQTTELFN